MDSVKTELHTFIDDPMDPVNNYNMGVKYFSAKQYAAAFSHFMRASERSDDTRFVARSLLYASKSMGWQEGRDSKELDLIAHALSIGYKYPEVHCIKAMYHSWRKDWTQCYAACCMALELIDTYEVDEPFLDYSGKETILNQKALAEYNRARYNDSRVTYNSILEMNITDCLRNQIQNKLKEFPEQDLIPRNVFLTWETSKEDISDELLYYINSWKNHNPQYNIRLYNKKERYEFIRDNFDSNVFDAYCRIKPGAFKCDLWRYCILYTHGGFYADIDTECLASLDTLCDNVTEFICPIDLNPVQSCRYNLSNGFIGSIPKHPLLKRCIDHIVDILKSYDSKDNIITTNITGPGCLGINMNKYLDLEWNSSFIGKEGMIKDRIKLLKFEKETECIHDISNKINILQNKNGNIEIKKAYDYECSKIKDHFCFGKFGNFTEIGNIVDYHTIPMDRTIFTLDKYHDNEPAYFYLFEDDLGPSACIKRGFKWEEHQHNIIDKYLDKDSVAIEIGSHIGTVTVKLSKVCKIVHAFEPIENTYTLLTDNMKINKCDNVVLHNLACGEKVKNVNVKWISANNPGGTGLEGGTLTKDRNIDEKFVVSVIPLDSIKFDKLDYIKIDVEGYEELVIEGSMETIKKHLPLIVIECFNKDKFNSHTHDAPKASDEEILGRYDFLIKLGYTFTHIAFEDFLFLPPRPKHIPSSITIDNFYDDPDEIREYALGLEYQPEENHGAVGFRSEAGRRILPGTRELFEKYLGREIKNWDVHRTNGCFQWCPETTRIVYHCDQTTYAAIIFLTPDAPPEAGLSLCRHKKYKIMDSSIFGKPDWYSPNRGHKEPHTDKTPWERVDRIGNVYNRLVLFNAKYVHAVSEYFGDQIHNSRLFQLFFFDI